MEVSIREMKNSLSKYLKLAQAGEDIVITDRGRQVVRLTPVRATEVMSEEESIRRIEALPWVTPGNGKKIRGARRPIRLRPGDKTAAEMVLEDRI